MTQDINDLKAGQIMLVVKKENGSFAALGLSRSQAIMLNRLLGYCSESEPFVVKEEVKLEIKK